MRDALRSPSGKSLFEEKALRKTLRARLADFRGLLRGDVPLARQALRKLLRDRDGNFTPLSFIPIIRAGRKTYEVRGAVLVAPLFNNIGTEDPRYAIYNGLIVPVRVTA